MEPRRDWFFLLTAFSLLFPCFGHLSTDSLNSAIRDYAFQALLRSRTGVLYRVPLPTNFSGMEASIVRQRSASFWMRGANISTFQVPPRAIPLPYVRRLVLVYQNLGNWSSSYYNTPGYSLVTPIVGLLAYDASNISSTGTIQLILNVTGDPISVNFPEVALPGGMNSTKKCARFGPDGSMHLDEMSSTNVCFMASTGHIAIVVPSAAPGRPSAERPVPEGEMKWRVWVGACGVVGVVVVGLVGLGVFRLVKKKKMEKMESRAEEDEILGTVWIGRSKMPSATLIRTKPVLEKGNAP